MGVLRNEASGVDVQPAPVAGRSASRTKNAIAIDTVFSEDASRLSLGTAQQGKQQVLAPDTPGTKRIRFQGGIGQDLLARG